MVRLVNLWNSTHIIPTTHLTLLKRGLEERWPCGPAHDDDSRIAAGQQPSTDAVDGKRSWTGNNLESTKVQQLVHLVWKNGWPLSVSNIPARPSPAPRIQRAGKSYWPNKKQNFVNMPEENLMLPASFYLKVWSISQFSTTDSSWQLPDVQRRQQISVFNLLLNSR